MTIKCHDFNRFMEIVYALTTQGLGFRADASTYTIELTGSH